MFPNLGEFNAIKKILDNSLDLKRESPHFRQWISVGDDASEFDGWLVTKDLSIENVHFRMDWSSSEEVVEKHIISNVSDISSMGGTPSMALLGLCLNKKWNEETKNKILKAVAKGFAKRGIALIGGDTVSGDVGMFSTTLIGKQVAPLTLKRKNAKINDFVYVSDTLGKSAAGLWILMNHPEDKEKFKELVEFHLCPKIKEDFGKDLALSGCSCCAIDISDGLSSELNHLALSSNKSIEIFEDKIPIDRQVIEMCQFYNLNPMDFALNGGEEYALLFTISSKNDIFFNSKFSSQVYKIGTIKEGSGVYKFENEKKVFIKAQAWSHL